MAKRVSTHGKAERRKTAEVRQKEYDALTPQEKLERLPKDGAKKQRTKLEHLIKYGRKQNEPQSPSNTTKRKNEKLSRKERWEKRNQE
tara:strand:- start:6079 stop:6342 length:264 start_codon:yes stop_codon:yes gene_type:complete